MEENLPTFENSLLCFPFTYSFLDDYSKVNIALTRASYSAFIIGNFEVLVSEVLHFFLHFYILQC